MVPGRKIGPARGGETGGEAFIAQRGRRFKTGDLKARGGGTAILSNGSPAMLQSAVEAAGLKDSLDVVLSVDAIRMYKPRPEVYALVTSHFAVPPGRVVFVSSNRWDVMGAAAFGFRTVWVNRAGMPDEYADAPLPTAVQNLSGLLTLKS